MKKIVLSILMLVFSILTISATETTISVANCTWKTDTVTTYGAGYTTTSNGFNISIYKNTSSTALLNPSTTSGAARIYKNAILIVSNSNGDNITNVVLKCVIIPNGNYCNNMTVGDGVATANATDTTVSWSGSTAKFAAVASIAQDRFTSITITSGAATAIQNPTFSVISGNYASTQNVALSCATEGASIYYTTDNSDPTASSTLYSAPLNISSTTTVKAIAIKGSDKSSITQAIYTFPVQINNISDLANTVTNTFVQFNTPLSTIIQKGTSLYVKDATGYMQLYGTLNDTYSNGDVLPAGVCGTLAIYNGGYEIKNPMNIGTKTTGTPVIPETYTINNLTAADANKYLKISNVNFHYDSKKPKFALGTDSLLTYNSFGITMPTTDITGCDIEGIVVIYNNAPEIYPMVITIPTNINDLKTDDKVYNIYDLSGRKVVNEVKGQLYIKNNKKYLSK
jgi:hypothetical protein